MKLSDFLKIKPGSLILNVLLFSQFILPTTSYSDPLLDAQKALSGDAAVPISSRGAAENMITDRDYQDQFQQRMSDDSDTPTTGASGAQDKESPIRFTSTSTRAPFLNNGNSYKITVCDSILLYKRQSDRVELGIIGGQYYNLAQINAASSSDGDSLSNPVPPEQVHTINAVKTPITEIEKELYKIFHKVTLEEIKEFDLMNEVVKGCTKLEEFLPKLQKVGTDGAGHDSDMMTAENTTWKYCLKNFGDNTSTPGNLVKRVIDSSGKLRVEVFLKNYQTIFYHAISTKLKKFQEIRENVSGAGADVEPFRSIITDFATKISRQYGAACDNAAQNFADSSTVQFGNGSLINQFELMPDNSVVAFIPHKAFIEVLKQQYGVFKEQAKSTKGLESKEARDEISVCMKSDNAMNFWKEVLEEAHSKVSRCAGLVLLTTRQRSYSKVNAFNKPDSGHKSTEGGLECTDIGAEAQDYDWCMSQVFAYEAMIAEEKLSQTKFNNDIQQLKASELATQDPNDPTAALKSQVKVLEMTRDQFDYKWKAQLAKAGVLGTMATLHGTIGSNVLSECTEVYTAQMFGGATGTSQVTSTRTRRRQQTPAQPQPQGSQGEGSEQNVLHDNQMGKIIANGKDYTTFQEALNEFVPANSHFPVVPAVPAGQACERAMLDVEALPNQNMAMKAGTLAIKMTADAGAFGLSINQIEEAISKLNKLIAEIENAVDGQIPENPFADLKQNPCLLDPTIEGCFEAGVGTNFGAGAGNVNIDGPEFGLSGAESVDEKKLDENNATGEKGSGNGNLNKAKVAGVLNNTSRAKGVQDRVGAARIKTNPSAGGGGGGGGGGGSAPGVGGGGGGRGRGGGGGSNYQKRDYKLSTGGKGGTRALFSGGQGIGGSSGKKARRDKNPFAKLAKGKSVDKFRNPAAIGKKGKSIWDTITNRYTDVDKKGLLEKYESR